MSPIEELVELEAIKNVRYLYSHYYDGQQVEKLADLFTDDAICEFGPGYGGDWVGKKQIRENYAKHAIGEGKVHEIMHAVTNPWIRFVDDETANGRWYLLDLRTAEGADNPLALFGIYDDVYKKIGDQWLIHRTRIDFLWPKREYYGPRDQ
jgi:ketosteroid isomerase-like protein